MRDPDQPAVEPGAQRMHAPVLLELPPGAVVDLRRQGALVEIHVGAEQNFPGGAVGRLELADEEGGHRQAWKRFSRVCQRSFSNSDQSWPWSSIWLAMAAVLPVALREPSRSWPTRAKSRVSELG